MNKKQLLHNHYLAKHRFTFFPLPTQSCHRNTYERKRGKKQEEEWKKESMHFEEACCCCCCCLYPLKPIILSLFAFKRLLQSVGTFGFLWAKWKPPINQNLQFFGATKKFTGTVVLQWSCYNYEINIGLL